MRRDGDTRPLRRAQAASLTLRPHLRQPIRWLPRHGEPFCVVELLSQLLIRAAANLPIYATLMAALTLAVFLVCR